MDAKTRLERAIGPLPKHTSDIMLAEDRWQVPTYSKFPVAIVRGEGSYVWDAEGKKYLDLYGGHAVALPGHCHPRVVAAIQAQAERLLFYSNVVANDVRAVAVKALAELAPAGLRRVFLCNSGTEANETALKIARKFTHRMRVVSLVDGFHGRTLGALGATGLPKYRDPAYPVPVQHDYVPYGDLEATAKAVGPDTAAIILEPIPSMGGIRVAPRAYFEGLRALATERGALLVFDEVQTGFFGSGKPWMWQHHGVRPDVVAFGKKTQVCGLYCGPRVDEVKDNVFHLPSRINSTWGGSLVDMVRSQRFIEIIVEDKLCENVAQQGTRFVGGLRALAKDRGGFANVRGMGSLVAFTLPTADARNALLKDLREKKFLALASGERAIRFRMPLNVSAREVDLALERIAACLPARRIAV